MASGPELAAMNADLDADNPEKVPETVNTNFPAKDADSDAWLVFLRGNSLETGTAASTVDGYRIALDRFNQVMLVQELALKKFRKLMVGDVEGDSAKIYLVAFAEGCQNGLIKHGRDSDNDYAPAALAE